MQWLCDKRQRFNIFRNLIYLVCVKWYKNNCRFTHLNNPVHSECPITKSNHSKWSYYGECIGLFLEAMAYYFIERGIRYLLIIIVDGCAFYIIQFCTRCSWSSFLVYLLLYGNYYEAWSGLKDITTKTNTHWVHKFW